MGRPSSQLFPFLDSKYKQESHTAVRPEAEHWIWSLETTAEWSVLSFLPVCPE